jgi:hypothetical protein
MEGLKWEMQGSTLHIQIQSVGIMDSIVVEI